MATDSFNPGDEATGAPAIPRFEQTFPVLSSLEIDRVRRFAELRRWPAGALLFETGKPSAGLFVILSGQVAITQHDGLGHVTPVVEEGPGQFLAEVATLSGRAALTDGRAETDVEALLVAPADIHTLLIAEAELGEKIMRALILRRVMLVESSAGGAVLIGAPEAAGMARLRAFLTRNGHPNHLLDPHDDHDAAELVARYAPSPAELPLVVTPDGSVLRNPGITELARALGMGAGPTPKKLYDLAIVGCGPAGLATAVYAASECLSVAAIDGRAFGGQAGASARIENYLGFPTGISGQALTGRAFIQAQKFGAEVMIPLAIKTLDCKREGGRPLALESDEGERICARTVVVASGARYRRPAIENLGDYEGRGVWYWASPIEAQLAAGQEVALVGGGNSAGQAAVYLSGHASKVRMMVRGEGLAATMSSYLIERIAATPNIELMTRTEVCALRCDETGALSGVRWRNRATGEETDCDIRQLFLFIGADPATDWLAGCGVEVDATGFVVTADRLTTSVPGVFAVGDVRSGSVKRVGAAIGEGAQVVAAIHAYLAANPDPAENAS